MYQVTLGKNIFQNPTSKIVCVGRNYADHAKELNNPIPKQPLLFIKPNSTLVDIAPGIKIKKDIGEVHYELEIAILVGEKICRESDGPIESKLAGIGLGLDLTLRYLQSELKEKGHPWERAKAFDGSCPISNFVKLDSSLDLNNIDYSLKVNGEVKQTANSQNMLFDISNLIEEISSVFTLEPGDIILTGTPAGVGALKSNDLLDLSLDFGGKNLLKIITEVE